MGVDYLRRSAVLYACASGYCAGRKSPADCCCDPVSGDCLWRGYNREIYPRKELGAPSAQVATVRPCDQPQRCPDCRSHCACWQESQQWAKLLVMPRVTGARLLPSDSPNATAKMVHVTTSIPKPRAGTTQKAVNPRARRTKIAGAAEQSLREVARQPGGVPLNPRQQPIAAGLSVGRQPGRGRRRLSRRPQHR